MGRGEHVRPRPAPPPKKNDGADSEWERRALKTRNGRGGAQNVHKPWGGGGHTASTPPRSPPPTLKASPAPQPPGGGWARSQGPSREGKSEEGDRFRAPPHKFVFDVGGGGASPWGRGIESEQAWPQRCCLAGGAWPRLKGVAS